MIAQEKPKKICLNRLMTWKMKILIAFIVFVSIIIVERERSR